MFDSFDDVDTFQRIEINANGFGYLKDKRFLNVRIEKLKIVTRRGEGVEVMFEVGNIRSDELKV